MIKKQLLLLLTATAFVYPCASLANPLPSSPYTFVDLRDYFFPVLLLMEGLILAGLTEIRKSHFFRFWGAWTVITSATYIMLIIAMDMFDLSRNSSLATFIGEFIVTLVEAFALYHLLRISKIAGTEAYMASPIGCVVLSVYANSFSYFGGVFIMSHPELFRWITGYNPGYY